MCERWLGLTVSSDRVTMVDVEVPKAGGPLVIVSDVTWNLHKGDRAGAYRVMYTRLADYARENKVARAVVKGSAVSLGGTKKAHLEAAELRGIVLGALANATAVHSETKAHISRNFGDRKADEYLKDQAFWDAEVVGALRVGSREAALLLLAARE